MTDCIVLNEEEIDDVVDDVVDVVDDVVDGVDDDVVDDVVDVVEQSVGKSLSKTMKELFGPEIKTSLGTYKLICGPKQENRPKLKPFAITNPCPQFSE